MSESDQRADRLAITKLQKIQSHQHSKHFDEVESHFIDLIDSFVVSQVLQWMQAVS
jgi:hypothetical protein